MTRNENIREQEALNHLEKWIPKTSIGKKVKSKEMLTINEIVLNGQKLLEAEIVDTLIPNLETDLIAVGQSKGKFGGGKRSTWKQTQKKTMEGNKPKFTAVAIVGNKDGVIGLGKGKAKETVPAREKAVRNAKLNVIVIRRGCGSWKGAYGEPNSVPYKVRGKCGSVIVELTPAPKGTGLVIEKECAKMLQLAGIKDVYSKTWGSTKTKLNLIKACYNALEQLTRVKVSEEQLKKTGVSTGNEQ